MVGLSSVAGLEKCYNYSQAPQKKERKEIGLEPYGQLGECFTAGSLF